MFVCLLSRSLQGNNLTGNIPDWGGRRVSVMCVLWQIIIAASESENGDLNETVSRLVYGLIHEERHA